MKTGQPKLGGWTHFTISVSARLNRTMTEAEYKAAMQAYIRGVSPDDFAREINK